MTSPSTVSVPSGAALAKATLAAMAIGAVVLVTTVLPAEYGIDPTGAGRALGLLEVYGAATAATVPVGPATITAAPEGPVFTRPEAYASDSRQFTVGPYGTLEFKYALDERATMLFAWTATDELSYDFHTEPGVNPEASETFERGAASQAQGAYVAPYTGVHGWYWRNNTDRDVTIALTSTGFYRSARLYRGGGAGEDVALTGVSR